MNKPIRIIPQQNKQSCYHCGEDCVDENIDYDQKNFCCNGCKLVYQVLQESDLCNYYDLNRNPGTSQKEIDKRSNRFDFLLDEEVIQKLVDFKDEKETHITFSIPMIHCASCIWLLENLHKLHQGIISGRVDFIRKKVQIKFDPKWIDLKELVLLLSKIGYEPSISLADFEKKTSIKIDRKLIYKLAVAGFCFGNMMFFSLPEYFSETELLGEGFKGLFNYLNVLLALPVFFYSGSDYFRSAYLSLKGKKVNMDVPIAIGIFTLFFYSLFEIFLMGREGYMDTLGGLVFFLLIGKIYQQKTYDTLSFDRDYKAYFPLSVTKILKGEEAVIPLTKVEVGNVIRVRNEELIPADSILIEGEACIDYSFVTGEAVPVIKKKGQLIYAGGRQKGNAITLAVQKSPSQGYLTDLWNNETFEKEKPHGLNSLANEISGKFTGVVLLIAFLSLAFWSMHDIGIAVKAFTAVLIITCPCALAMSTPFTLGNTLRVFGQGKFYLKNADVIEKLAKTDTVVFDKTGTLTAPSAAAVTYHGERLSEESKSIIKAMVSLSTHPLSNRINNLLKEVKPAKVMDVQEWPGSGIQATYLSQVVRLGSKEFVGVHNFDRPEEGNLVYFSVEGMVLGYFSIRSGLRNGVGRLIEELSDNRSIHIISGDSDHEAASLRQLVGPKVRMKFNQSPDDKLRYVKKLGHRKANTLMIGDGLNDAGALRASQVGIALTEHVGHFSPASDAILDASALNLLPTFVAFSKTSRNIIKASFGLSFAYNFVGIFFAVQGLVSPVFCAILMPISSISVVAFTTLTTNFLAYRKGIKSKIL
ncbi:heavy metal translocating P-type ATPase [Pararhodonellum marinum]|uniref:heavy metal translocating P-type ATPase n=1 Tax=Pararhodonellum marinum TaxID=2755358 RepID=UPI00188EF77D|nr:heavy metal translocating P-type ATPase metal-binding domain-containing protein [Pararhodonellum marinum]